MVYSIVFKEVIHVNNKSYSKPLNKTIIESIETLNNVEFEMNKCYGKNAQQNYNFIAYI